MVVGQMAPQGIILCETERNEQLPESAGDYEIARTYFTAKQRLQPIAAKKVRRKNKDGTTGKDRGGARQL